MLDEAWLVSLDGLDEVAVGIHDNGLGLIIPKGSFSELAIALGTRHGSMMEIDTKHAGEMLGLGEGQKEKVELAVEGL